MLGTSKSLETSNNFLQKHSLDEVTFQNIVGWIVKGIFKKYRNISNIYDCFNLSTF